MSSSDDDSISFDVQQAADEAINLTVTIPERSKATYETCYKHFCDWQTKMNNNSITEKTMMAYFMQKSEVQKSSTMWSDYSKLKCMISLNHNVNISAFTALNAFLKRQSADYVAKKSKTFTRLEMDRFLAEADDRDYLMMKVALIIGIAGACRRDELLKLSTNDVIDSGEFVQIDIKDAKTNIPKQYVITESSIGNCNMLNIIRNYISRRNPNTPNDRFFVGYRQGKCFTQPVGINTIGAIPKRIANFLGLSEVELYTGHCFRRSSASVLAEYGTEFSVFKRHSVDGLRRMIPNYKQQSESNQSATGSDAKLKLKIEPNATSECDNNFEQAEYQQHDNEEVDDEDDRERDEIECESKPQIFNIKYMVPSSLIIREHQQSDQHRDEPATSFQQSSKAIRPMLTHSNQRQSEESDVDQHMQDIAEEVLPDNGTVSLSTQAKIDNLRLKEMENRVTESRLRCEVQKLMVSKAEEEFKHLQEMNRLRLQEAKLRLKMLEQSSTDGRSVSDPLNSA